MKNSTRDPYANRPNAIPVQIMLTRKQKAALDEYSRTKGETRSCIVRSAIRNIIEPKEEVSRIVAG